MTRTTTAKNDDDDDDNDGNDNMYTSIPPLCHYIKSVGR